MSTVNFSCFDINLTVDFITEEEWTPPPDRDIRSIVIISSILCLLTVVGIPLNIFVLLVLVRREFYKEPSSFLLFNLASVDLLSCVMFVPFYITPGFHNGVYVLGNSDYHRCLSCYAGSMAIIWLLLVSLHLLAVMSTDRLLYIQQPLHYHHIVTVPRLLVAILVIWGICFLLVLPPIFEFGDIRYSDTLGTCAPSITSETRVGKSYFYILLLLLEVMFPLALLFGANIKLICVLRKESKKRLEISTVQSNETKATCEINERAKKKYNSQQLLMVKIFGSIFISNMATWLPAFLIMIVILSYGSGHLPPGLYGLLYLNFFSQPVIHPMIETFLVGYMRTLLMKILCSCLKKEVNGKKSNL